jgi:hypothetical protein
VAGKCLAKGVLERKSSNFSQVFAFTDEQIFPSRLVVGWKNVPQQVRKTRSKSAYVKFRERVVCRKCYFKLIIKSGWM